MGKNLFLRLFIFLLILSVGLNSFASIKEAHNKEFKKEQKQNSQDESPKEEVKAKAFDAVIPFTGVALEKDLYVISTFEYSYQLTETSSQEESPSENKFFKALVCFFIAKKGP